MTLPDGSSRGNRAGAAFCTALGLVPEGFSLFLHHQHRMELLGCIVGLEALKRPCTVTVYSDSQYLVNAFNQNWVAGWLKRGWKNSQKQPVKNVDLWKRLLAAKEPHTVKFVWVKGHAGHAENERCDELATTAADNPACHQQDTGFRGDL
ncbi:MAG: ribonuclease HI [Coriobacteriaceae bacterium]